jgi:hypothetical protein
MSWLELPTKHRRIMPASDGSTTESGSIRLVTFRTLSLTRLRGP